MSSSFVGDMLKTRRKELNFSVKCVLEQLQNMGVKISDKTLYGWENGHRQPDADVFLLLCKIYDIKTIAGMNRDSSTDGESPVILDQSEKELLDLYRELNQEGQEKVVGYARDLVRTCDYKKVGSFWMGSKEA